MSIPSPDSSRADSSRRRMTVDRQPAGGPEARSSSSCRSSIRRILPVSVFGRSGTNSTQAGIGVGREAVTDERLDLGGELVGRQDAVDEDDERLDDVAAELVGRRDGGRFPHRRVLEACRFDLERADPVAGGDDHVVGASDVPVVAVLVLDRRVLRVEPVAAERLAARFVVAPVAERVVRVGAGAEADLATFAARDGLLVLVEDPHVPAGHRLAHRALAHLQAGVVGDEGVRLGQPVVVEDGDTVLLPEPADRLGVEWLAGRAHATEDLRVARPRVVDRHHRAHRRRRREDVRHLVPAEEVELSRGVEPCFATVDALHRPEPPRPEQRSDPGSPGPLAHPVEALAVLDLVAVDELLVAEDVPVRVDDPFRQPCRPGRVVELGRIVGRRVGADRRGRCGRQGVRAEHEHLGCPRAVEPRCVVDVGDEKPRPGIGEAMLDPVVAVQHRHREEDRSQLPHAEEDRGCLRRRREHDGDAIARGDAVGGERMRRLVREVLKLSPRELPARAVEALPDHRVLVARVLVADVRGDVVARGNVPAVRRAQLLVRRALHRRRSSRHRRTVPLMIAARATSRNMCLRAAPSEPR